MPLLDTKGRERDNSYKVGPENLICLYGDLAVAHYPSWMEGQAKIPPKPRWFSHFYYTVKKSYG